MSNSLSVPNLVGGGCPVCSPPRVKSMDLVLHKERSSRGVDEDKGARPA